MFYYIYRMRKKKCATLLDEIKFVALQRTLCIVVFLSLRANLHSAVLNSVHFYIKSEYTSYYQT